MEKTKTIRTPTGVRCEINKDSNSIICKGVTPNATSLEVQEVLIMAPPFPQSCFMLEKGEKYKDLGLDIDGTTKGRSIACIADEDLREKVYDITTQKLLEQTLGKHVMHLYQDEDTGDINPKFEQIVGKHITQYLE
jgi:hypothetical protein